MNFNYTFYMNLKRNSGKKTISIYSVIPVPSLIREIYKSALMIINLSSFLSSHPKHGFAAPSQFNTVTFMCCIH